jgi:hypothetical protein
MRDLCSVGTVGLKTLLENASMYQSSVQKPQSILVEVHFYFGLDDKVYQLLALQSAQTHKRTGTTQAHLGPSFRPLMRLR